MSRSIRTATLAFGMSALVTFGSVSIVLAAWTGQLNGLDSPNNGWIGADDPDGETGSYSVDNVRQDGRLFEWGEPAHDRFANQWNRFGAAAETKLDTDQDKGLDFEFRIHEQDFYNYANIMNTNLPWSGVDPDAWFEEPFCQPAGCTEVDVEIQDTWRIEQGIDYWVEIMIDSERNPTTTRPDFVTEIEYCNSSFVNCNFDATAWFRKKLVVR